jgi:hypothetical protein
VINRRLVEALRVEVGLLDKGGDRGGQHDKEGYENRQTVGCRPGERQIYSPTSPEGYDNRQLSLPVCCWSRMGLQ